MFIRENKTTNKKTGDVYIKHVLVESVRIHGQPRQRVVMGLGLLDLPRREWKKLAHALECQLSGQISLLECNDKYIDDLALSLVSNNKLSKNSTYCRQQRSQNSAITFQSTLTPSLLRRPDLWVLNSFVRMPGGYWSSTRY